MVRGDKGFVALVALVAFASGCGDDTLTPSLTLAEQDGGADVSAGLHPEDVAEDATATGDATAAVLDEFVGEIPVRSSGSDGGPTTADGVAADPDGGPTSGDGVVGPPDVAPGYDYISPPAQDVAPVADVAPPPPDTAQPPPDLPPPPVDVPPPPPDVPPPPPDVPPPPPDVVKPPPCGNGTCDSGETTANCPADCKSGTGTWTCGDAKCDIGEQFYCDKDCLGPQCGDGKCAWPETKDNCAKDCKGGGGLWVCGDGKCDIGEQFYCAKDCQPDPGKDCWTSKCGTEQAKCAAKAGCQAVVTCALKCNGNWSCIQACGPGGSAQNQEALAVLVCGQSNGCL